MEICIRLIITLILVSIWEDPIEKRKKRDEKLNLLKEEFEKLEIQNFIKPFLRPSTSSFSSYISINWKELVVGLEDLENLEMLYKIKDFIKEEGEWKEGYDVF